MQLDFFLGHEMSWWIAINAVLKKVGFDDPDKLAAHFGVTAPPFWTEKNSKTRKYELEQGST